MAKNLIITVLALFICGFSNIVSAQTYQNDVYKCKMELPDGWFGAGESGSDPSKDMFYLMKHIPVYSYGKQMGEMVIIQRRFLNSSFNTFDELPEEQVVALKERYMKPAIERNIQVEGTIKKIGKHKVIWITRTGKETKTLDVDFMVNKYMWDFHVCVLSEYYDTMVFELEKMIESFDMI